MTPTARPEVLAVEVRPAAATLQLRVPADLRYFPGHFPQRPILPGVVQLAWAASLGQEHLGAGSEVLRLEGLKFSRVIQPEARLMLLLEWSAQQRRLAFRFTEGEAACSSGRFIFAS